MEVRLIADAFRSDWANGIDGIVGASAGCLRALGAHADADVAELVETIKEHAAQTSPVGAARYVLAWGAWHREYVRAEIARLLPELRERWPTREDKKAKAAARARVLRWKNNGADIVRMVQGGEQSMYPAEWVRRRLGLETDRFSALVAALVTIQALRVVSGVWRAWQGDMLVATLDPTLAWRRLEEPMQH